MDSNTPGEIAASAVEHSRAAMSEWVSTFELFADPTRLKIMVAVHAAPEASVSEIAAATGISANTVTQALTTLQNASVVSSRKDGRYRRWRLTDDAAHQVLHHMNAPHTPLHPDH
ncbi:ArsR/SmtB family transcription factor [Ornithinimicrobium faecis]|uniref:Metalloregulator ArsR/SmtB family transcription factor n=1 Tax=Ornithinimicrobium faecis TaxID=2934158 RepID=A0ABY4YYU2_9MICO|nr:MULTISPECIES: metalloregulator ArsR/SmtB family transcription factor [unclassified Ornithinimicrobium]USQ81615.1 metalloregulator ArsR/SmtB family transcription factor [Ornithinimicrobium sp. HY1793]